MKNIKFLILFSSLCFSQIAHADMFKSTLFSLNTIYLDREYDDNGVKSKLKQTDTDFRLTRIEKHWAYGAVYSLSANDSSSASRSSLGLSVGYFSEKDFYMSLSYYLSSKYQLGNGSEYSKGSGYEFGVGFLSKVTSSVYVGLLVALKNFEYKEQTFADGSTADISATHKEVLPMFTFGFSFM
jgi:hypothetical protein